MSGLNFFLHDFHSISAVLYDGFTSWPLACGVFDFSGSLGSNRAALKGHCSSKCENGEKLLQTTFPSRIRARRWATRLIFLSYVFLSLANEGHTRNVGGGDPSCFLRGEGLVSPPSMSQREEGALARKKYKGRKISPLSSLSISDKALHLEWRELFFS